MFDGKDIIFSSFVYMFGGKDMFSSFVFMYKHKDKTIEHKVATTENIDETTEHNVTT
jgi:hypothetical protein